MSGFLACVDLADLVKTLDARVRGIVWALLDFDFRCSRCRPRRKIRQYGISQVSRRDQYKGVLDPVCEPSSKRRIVFAKSVWFIAAKTTIVVILKLNDVTEPFIMLANSAVTTWDHGKAAFGPNWPTLLELIPVSVAWSRLGVLLLPWMGC